MKNRCLVFLLLCLSGPQLAQAQLPKKLVFVGTSLNVGVGAYNGLGIGTSLLGRVQMPLGDVPNLALTGKIGLDIFRVSTYSYVPGTYLGYGYNPISGYGFNTLYSGGSGYSSFAHATGLSIPFNFGPRLYLPSVADGAYIGLNVGVDIGVSDVMGTAMHVEPTVGWLMPLPNGHVLDLNTAYLTSFARGSGVFAFGAAYSLR